MDYFPKVNNGLHPFLFNTKFYGRQVYTAWHVPPENIHEHTDRFILLKSIN